jgi:hypothetical protein
VTSLADLVDDDPFEQPGKETQAEKKKRELYEAQIKMMKLMGKK